MIGVTAIILAMTSATPRAYRLAIDIVDAHGTVSHPAMVVEEGQVAQLGQPSDGYTLAAHVTSGATADVAHVEIAVKRNDASPVTQDFEAVVKTGDVAEMRYPAPAFVRRVSVRLDRASLAAGAH